MLHAQVEGIPQRRAAARQHPLEDGVLHVVPVLGEVQQQFRLVVGEIDDEHLVVRVGVFEESQHRLVDQVEPLPHAAAGVDDQPERNRQISRMEQGKLLKDPFVVNPEVVGFERVHPLAGLVEDRHVEGDHPHLDADAIVIALPVLSQDGSAHPHGRDQNQRHASADVTGAAHNSLRDDGQRAWADPAADPV